jgi:hypothetical protein
MGRKGAALQQNVDDLWRKRDLGNWKEICRNLVNGCEHKWVGCDGLRFSGRGGA